MKIAGPILVLTIAFAFGYGIWALSPLFTGHVEPWDADSVFYLLGLILAGVIASIPAPKYWWLAGFGAWAGQSAFIVTHGPPSPFGPLGLAIAGLPSLLAMAGGGCVWLAHLIFQWVRFNTRDRGGRP